jgi:hypothetical protein
MLVPVKIALKNSIFIIAVYSKIFKIFKLRFFKMIKLALVLSITLITSDFPVSKATCSYGICSFLLFEVFLKCIFYMNQGTVPDVDGKNCRGTY